MRTFQPFRVIFQYDKPVDRRIICRGGQDVSIKLVTKTFLHHFAILPQE